MPTGKNARKKAQRKLANQSNSEPPQPIKIDPIEQMHKLFPKLTSDHIDSVIPYIGEDGKPKFAIAYRNPYKKD